MISFDSYGLKINILKYLPVFPTITKDDPVSWAGYVMKSLGRPKSFKSKQVGSRR
jgi:hypothetical protein